MHTFTRKKWNPRHYRIWNTHWSLVCRSGFILGLFVVSKSSIEQPAHRMHFFASWIATIHLQLTKIWKISPTLWMLQFARTARTQELLTAYLNSRSSICLVCWIFLGLRHVQILNRAIQCQSLLLLDDDNNNQQQTKLTNSMKQSNKRTRKP